MRGFNPPLAFGEGLRSSSDESGRQERSLDGVGRFAGQEHSRGLGHQAGRIGHVRGRRQIKQPGLPGLMVLKRLHSLKPFGEAMFKMLRKSERRP